MFFGYKRCYSVTYMLQELAMRSFDTVIANSVYSFTHHWSVNVNCLVQHLRCVLI
jgi:hypothetical protein